MVNCARGRCEPLICSHRSWPEGHLENDDLMGVGASRAARRNPRSPAACHRPPHRSRKWHRAIPGSYPPALPETSPYRRMRHPRAPPSPAPPHSAPRSEARVSPDRAAPRARQRRGRVPRRRHGVRALRKTNCAPDARPRQNPDKAEPGPNSGRPVSAQSAVLNPSNSRPRSDAVSRQHPHRFYSVARTFAK